MKSFGFSPVCCALGKALGFCPECAPSFILTAASFSAASLCFPGTDPLSLEWVQRLVYFLLATKAPPLPTPRHWAAVFLHAWITLFFFPSFGVSVWLFWVLIHFAQTLPWHWPGHRSPAPFYVFLFSRQMSSISVASAFQPLPLRGVHFLKQAPAVQSLWKGGQTGDGGSGSAGCTSEGECGDFDNGTDGHGQSGILWHCLIGPFPFFTSRKGAFGEDFCPSLYFYDPHVQWNIKCNSLTSFSQPLLPSYHDGDNIDLTWSL